MLFKLISKEALDFHKPRARKSINRFHIFPYVAKGLICLQLYAQHLYIVGDSDYKGAPLKTVTRLLDVRTGLNNNFVVGDGFEPPFSSIHRCV